jgi:hypothetical protein
LIYDDDHRPDGRVVTEIGAVCSDAGLDLDFIGRRLGRVVNSPETYLPTYDIVFATGRLAIEALACGCAVIVLGATGLWRDGWCRQFREVAGQRFRRVR